VRQIEEGTMRRIESGISRFAVLTLVGVLLLGGLGVPSAHATASPVGACCLASGQCQSLNQFDCDSQNGDFIGPDTSCLMIDCPAAAAKAPVLSILGLVAAVGALTALGLYRLVGRRA
jgi:hypothetical protein